MSENTQKKKNNTGAWISIVIVVLVFIVIGALANSQSSSNSSSSDATSNNTITTEPTTPPPPYIPASDISLTNLQLNGFHNEITGQAFNYSSYPVNSIEVGVDVYDCLQDYYLSTDCTQIGEDNNVDLFIEDDAFGSIPSNQEREISGLVSLEGMPPVQGYLVWNYNINNIVPGTAD